MKRRNQGAASFLKRLLLGALILAVVLIAFPERAMAQDSNNDCKAIPKQINDLVDKVAEVSQRIGRVEYRVENKIGSTQSLETDKHTLETDKSTLRKSKLKIDNLLDQLCACCAKKPATGTTKGTIVCPESEK